MQFTGTTMGTTYTVKVVEADSPVDSRSLRRGVDVRLQEVDARMSTWKSDSELSRFNSTDEDGWIGVSPELFAVVRLAREVSELTGGAFDVTVGPLVNLWGFGPGDGSRRAPAPAELLQARERSGFHKLQLAGDRTALRKLHPGLYVDLSGIAKGHGVDVVSEWLEGRGIRNYLVEVGGEVRARGSNATGQPWRIGIERPLDGGRAVERMLALRDHALATSGDYRNYFEQDGVRYSHLIDPVTGEPVRHRLASVSVLDPLAARADALATALLVLGPVAGLELAEREGIPALFIIREEDGFRDRWTGAMERWLVE